jgi:hypothetical protein
MDSGLAEVAQPADGFRLPAQPLEVVEPRVHAVDGGRLSSRPRSDDQGGAGMERLLPAVLDAELQAQVHPSKSEIARTRAGGDLEGPHHAERCLHRARQRQVAGPSRHPLQVCRGLDLRDADAGAAAGHCGQVGQRQLTLRLVDPHPRLGMVGQRLPHLLAGAHLHISGHRVLEVEQHGVRPGIEDPRQDALAVTRPEEPAADGGHRQMTPSARSRASSSAP